MNARNTPIATGGPTLKSLARASGVSDEAQALLREDDAPHGYVTRLIEDGFPKDAVKLLGAMLPPREAIWWAWTCSRKAAGDEAPPEVTAALAAIEKWLREPTDANRRAAMDAGEEADLSTPAGCVALATFFSGGSIAPPEVEPVAPPPFVAGKTLATAIILSAVIDEPEKAPEKLQGFLDQGIHVAKRVGAWPS